MGSELHSSRQTPFSPAFTLAALVVVGLARPASADPMVAPQNATEPIPPPSRTDPAQQAAARATARELANGGADAFDAGDYATALDNFRRAQALFPAPTLALMEGRTLLQLGRWVEAYEKFNAIARNDLGPSEPEAFQRAASDARDEASRLDLKLPRLELRIEPGDDTQITLNGERVVPALLNLQRPIDPGRYVVEANKEGIVYFSRTIEISPEQRVRIEIPLPVAAAPPTPMVAPPPPALPPQASAEPQAETPRWVVPVAFAVGGVGAATAGVSLFLAADSKSELDEACTPVCPRSHADELNAFRTYRTLVFVGAAVGVVGVGVGGYFTLWDNDGAEQVAVGLGPTQAELVGRF